VNILNINELTFKMMYDKELNELGNVEFIKKYFSLKDEKVMNEIVLNLYNDLTYDELYVVLTESGSLFLNKLYEFKNELKLNNSDFLLFKQIILSNENFKIAYDDLTNLRPLVYDLHQKIHDVIDRENTTTEHMNFKFAELSASIEGCLEKLERLNI
jgi:hypothetical protein